MQRCDNCGKSRLWQSTTKVNEKGARIWKCRSCQQYQAELPPQGLKTPPKILYFDIETALMKFYGYDLRVRDGYISKDMIAQRSFVINWAAAWLDDKFRIKGGLMTGIVTPKEAREQNDKRVCSKLWKLMDEADYLVGHNSDNFDIKKMNWHFLRNGLSFPAESKRQDTLKLARKHLRAPSLSLEFLAVELGGKPKKSLDRKEWIEIVDKGTPELLKKADTYCKGDVREGVFVLRKIGEAIQANGRARLFS